MREIERKFLVADVPSGLEKRKRYEISQAYLAIDPGGTQVRLRKSNDERSLTVKRGSGVEREERNVALPAEEFDSLWELTKGRRLRKTRYDIEHGKLTIELDVFHGTHEGLVFAEVEFPDAEQAAHFQPPTWFGDEVTQDSRYANSSLARE